MMKIDLLTTANGLPDAWRSRVISHVGNAQIKLLRMDTSPHAEEVHDYNEALLVLQGKLVLFVEGQCRTLNAGELLMVEAGQPHAVCAGSNGSLLIVDVA